MAKLLYSATMSLDGFIAGPGGDMSWLTEHRRRAGTHGRRGCWPTSARSWSGHNTFGGDDPNRGTDKEGAFGGQYHGPVVVLTHRPPGRPARGRRVLHRPAEPPSTRPRRPRATGT